ncbi:MAG: 30S ribosomal protein S5 [Minisyncoccota bacterium]
MTDELIQPQPEKVEATPASTTSSPAATSARPVGQNDRRGGAARGGDKRRGGRGPARGGDRRGGPRKGGSGRERSEFDHKTIDVRRVTRVVAGGRRFSFSVALVAGNRKGSVGVGTGKAGDTAAAIEKAIRDAKKNMIKLALTKASSIPHEVEAKYSSAIVHIMPASGRGIVAGSATRTVLDLAGITDVGAKIFSGSKNKLNIARATIKALSTLKRPKGGALYDVVIEAVSTPEIVPEPLVAAESAKV